MTVVLRDIRPEDKFLIRAWRNSRAVAGYMFTDHLITLEEHERWFKEILGDPRRRYWIISHNQKDVGLANLYGIDATNKRAYWGSYLANEGSRGKGVGAVAGYLVLRYVFDELHFNRLCCEVLVANSAAMNLYKSFGFVQEAYFRQHIIKNGQFVDVVSLALLREDWVQRKLEIEQRLKEKGLI